MHARVIFCRVGGLLETLLVVDILTKGKKSINAGKNENVELPHTQVFCFFRLECCVDVDIPSAKIQIIGVN